MHVSHEQLEMDPFDLHITQCRVTTEHKTDVTNGHHEMHAVGLYLRGRQFECRERFRLT